jgi:hypothetical protein
MYGESRCGFDTKHESTKDLAPGVCAFSSARQPCTLASSPSQLRLCARRRLTRGKTHFQLGVATCWGTSLIRKHHPIGPYSKPMPRALGWSWEGGGFLWARYPCTPASSPSQSQTLCEAPSHQTSLGGLPREQQMLEGHLPRVMYY